MPAIDTDELSSQFVSQYRDNVFCNQQKVKLTCMYMYMYICVDELGMHYADAYT